MPWPFRSGRSKAPDTREAGAAPVDQPKDKPRPTYARWNLEAGAPIAEGRTVLKRLGGGSAYEVYVVWDDRLFSLMVAKILRPDRTEDARAHRELRREAALLERLAHPALVRGFGADLDGRHPHVLLELAEGPTLGRLIKKEGALPLQQLLPIALHVAAVLRYLAHEEVAHLDVKPGNIVMSVTPCLIDLSIARSYEQAAKLKGGIGTQSYMAPEQCDPGSSPSPIGAAADVWGLGATLYHATAGKLPFARPNAGNGAGDSTDPTARYPQILEAPAPLPKHVPARHRELILDMLNKDPRARPAAQDVAVALKSLVEKMTGRIRKRARRRNPGRKRDQ